MYSEYEAQAAAYRLAEVTGEIVKLDHNDITETSYVFYPNGVNVVLRVPDWCIASVLEFAQRCANQAVNRERQRAYDAGRFGG